MPWVGGPPRPPGLRGKRPGRRPFPLRPVATDKDRWRPLRATASGTRVARRPDPTIYPAEVSRRRPIYVESRIRAPMDAIWAATQEPDRHQRWDLRFGRIEYRPRGGDEVR